MTLKISHIATFVVLFVTAFLSLSTLSAQAAVPVVTELDGYAWSSNIGWISLNCKTGGATGNNICGTSNYKVTINTSGTVTGYAWSSNIGWIKFGGLSGFPTGGGTYTGNARVVGTYPNLTLEGWARACAGTNNPTTSERKDCTSMTINDNSGDWDGWISLEGTNYGVTTNNGGMVSGSYSWGSDVIGWIDMFSQVRWLKPTATISVGACPVKILEGQSTCNAPVTWNIQNASNPSVFNALTSDQYTTIASGTAVMYPVELGSNVIQARDASTVLNSATLNVTASSCTDPDMIISGSGTCEFPPPSVVVTVDKKIARKGDTVVVNWVITPSPIESGSCTLSGPGLSGNVTTSGSQTSSPLQSKSVFKVICTGPFGSVEGSAVVDLIPTSQEV